MIRNYLKVALRSFSKNKVYTFINITGLGVGMAVTLLISLWVWDELSFDSYHENRGRLARIMSTTTFNGETSTDAWAAIPLADALRSRYSGDFKHLALISGNNSHVLVVGDKKIAQPGIWVQPAFPAMFTLKMVKGRRGALSDPSSILITQSVANALFGDADPMNKTVRVDNEIEMNVAGVYEDLPLNTSLYDAKFLLPWDKYITTEPAIADAQRDWNNHHFGLFVQMSDQADFDKTTAKIKDITKPYIKGRTYEEILLHPMDQWHLYNEFKNGKMVGGRIQLVWLFGITGVFVLFLASINFMNLSTARSEKRAKEVGIRKAIGSMRAQLIGQFLTESLLVSFLSFIVAMVLVQLSLPFFNAIADKRIFIPFVNPWFWLFTMGFTIFTGLVSGSYPAFYLSGFDPIKILKGTFRVGRFSILPRKVLVVVQFTVSITLIIGTVIVFRQIRYAQNRSLGYNEQGLISIPMKTPEIHGHYDALRNDLIQTGAVENMSESSSPLTNVHNHMLGFKWKGKDPDIVPLIGTIAVTHDFGKTIGWQMLKGRDFSRSFPSDTDALILNESAVRLTGFKNPVGETMNWNGKDRVVTGVVKDLVMESPYMPVGPTVFFLNYGWKTAVITLRIKPSIPLTDALTKIETVFKKYDPASPFEYEFTDEQFAWKFYDEQQIVNLATLFAVLAIFISCLGLFGLASFVAEQRNKEIGVRKVLGASVFDLWKMLSKEFVALVILSCVIAAPIAWHFLNQWLQKFEYRTEISWWIFPAAGIGALLIALLTVSYQAIKAAMINPVKSLKLAN